MVGSDWGKLKTCRSLIADFAKEEIVVRGDPEEGTKNGEIQRVPMIAQCASNC